MAGFLTARIAGRPARPTLPGLTLLLLLGLTVDLRADPWPSWRGPQADGTSVESGFAVQWNVEPGREENLIWKQSLPGSRGGSSPIVWGDYLFITAQAGTGPVEGEFTVEGVGSSGIVVNDGNYDVRLFVIALRTRDGAIAWAVEVPAGRYLVPIGRAYDYASPSCVTDGERVYAWFGTGPVAAFDMQGRGLWQRRLEEEFGPFDVRWGHGSSPMLRRGPPDPDLRSRSRFLCPCPRQIHGRNPLEARSGQAGRSYSTPVAAELGGRRQVLVNWPYEIGGIDAREGNLLWTVRGLDYMMVPMPVVDDGIIYTTGGERSGPIMALRPPPDAQASADNIIWRHASGGPYIASPLKLGGELYTAGETGVIKCFDAATGARIWQGRGGASYFASPVAADGLIYMVDEAGDTVVFRSGREFDVVARNRIGERTVASPALADGRIYIRTDRAIYCIGDAP
jgi:outer membrane protein assembly factor BamB